MIDSNTVESISEKIINNLPKGGKALADDLKKNMKVALTSTLERMDLVTREEFDTQAALLSRTRARLEALEAKISQLESSKLS